MDTPFIIHRGQRQFFNIPSAWNLLTFASLDDQPQPKDVSGLTRKALSAATGSSPLNERLSPSDTVAILIEDLTRASPKGIILKAVLEELEKACISRNNITIVIALGTHRGLTPEELEVTFGRDLVTRYTFINHDCHSPDLIPSGRLTTGRAVKINRAVHEARFRIGIGSIFPHPMNGFGGGGKILFPGVADFDSILEHHFQFTFHEGAGLGKIEGNLFYEQVCAIATAARLDFIINSILDQKDHVNDLVCGDPVHAHLAGIEKSKRIISREFQRKADLTVITSFPYTEGPQIVKPLAPASMVTKEGGCIILCADLTGDLPDAFVESFDRFHAEYGDDLLGGVLDHFKKNRLIMKGGAIDFNMALGMTLAIQHRFRIILVSQEIPKEKVEKMGFMYARDLQEAFDLVNAICPRPDVHIIPSGGVILPVLRSQQRNP
ncbi:MAG: nickel-dependent lactate racemase [Pseudomonadota bacterium]